MGLYQTKKAFAQQRKLSTKQKGCLPNGIFGNNIPNKELITENSNNLTLKKSKKPN